MCSAFQSNARFCTSMYIGDTVLSSEGEGDQKKIKKFEGHAKYGWKGGKVISPLIDVGEAFF